MSKPMRTTRTVLTRNGGIKYYMSYGNDKLIITVCLRYGRQTFERVNMYRVMGSISQEIQFETLKALVESELDGNVLAPQIWFYIYEEYKRSKLLMKNSGAAP